jgi:hypothetical protein
MTSAPAAADVDAPAPADATVIELSWHEPEQFALLFDLHAPRIPRSQRTDPEVSSKRRIPCNCPRCLPGGQAA